MSDTGTNISLVQKDEAEVEVYSPRFSKILPNLIDSFKEKWADMNFVVGEGRTTSPSVTLTHFTCNTANRGEPDHGGHLKQYECHLQLDAFVEYKDIDTFHDRFVNVLHYFAARTKLRNLTSAQKTLYPIGDNTNIVRIGYAYTFYFIDKLADTTYPIVDEADCSSCTNEPKYGITLRDYEVKDIIFNHAGGTVLDYPVGDPATHN